MHMPKHIDYIIVGQGLAGSAVALQLLKRNKKVLVVDAAFAHAPSRVAIGMFNPITGRNSVKTWMADQLFPYLRAFYKSAELQTHQRFFYSIPLYRPFCSIEEQNEWMGRSVDPIYTDYIDKVFTRPWHDAVKDDFGGLVLRHTGYLDTLGYLEAVRTLISARGTLFEELFDDELLDVDETGVRYKGCSAQHIIFCQGLESTRWFKWVPVLPLKGEIIRIQCDLRENIMVNRGVYLVPVNQVGSWRVGSTYSLTDGTKGITELARIELMTKLNELVTFPYTLQSQEWGFRPTMHDRRPALGTHPEQKRLHIFNGLGPKGVSLAPYFSDILVQSIENHRPLNKDVDIERYKLLYWSPSTRI
jgi:glycine oxidase